MGHIAHKRTNLEHSYEKTLLEINERLDYAKDTRNALVERMSFAKAHSLDDRAQTTTAAEVDDFAQILKTKLHSKFQYKEEIFQNWRRREEALVSKQRLIE